MPGLWFEPVHPDRLVALSKTCATEAYGYWYYTLYSLQPDQAKLPQGYAAPQPWTVEDYWRAIRQAGEETDRAMAAGVRSGAAPGPRPQVLVSLNERAPSLDGNVNDAKWAPASVLGPFRLYRDGQPATVPSSARLLCDGTTLLCRRPLLRTENGRAGPQVHDPR